MLTFQDTGSGRYRAGNTDSARESSDALCTLCDAFHLSVLAESVEHKMYCSKCLLLNPATTTTKNCITCRKITTYAESH